MTKPYNKVREAMALYRQAFETANKAADVMRGGPADYYLGKLEGYVEALFGKYAPFKEGDRVELTQAPDTNNHWHSSRHFLIPGSKGTVHEVDYYDGSFRADVQFDDESWVDLEGMTRPPQNYHVFRLAESFLRVLKGDLAK